MTALKYAGLGIAGGLLFAIGGVQYDRYSARQAQLSALPEGYEFSGCNAVRAAGLDPLYSWERGYSERMDGDRDGIACEPYRH